MGLGIYTTPAPGAVLSNGGDFTNPLRLSFNGTTGATKIFKYWLRNNDNIVYYENILITPVSIVTPNIVDGSAGFGYKLIAGDVQPLEDEWNTIDFGNSVEMDNIGTSGDSGHIYTYLPFFARITVPRGSDIRTYQNVTLRIEAIENLV